MWRAVGCVRTCVCACMCVRTCACVWCYLSRSLRIPPGRHDHVRSAGTGGDNAAIAPSNKFVAPCTRRNMCADRVYLGAGRFAPRVDGTGAGADATYLFLGDLPLSDEQREKSRRMMEDMRAQRKRLADAHKGMPPKRACTRSESPTPPPAAVSPHIALRLIRERDGTRGDPSVPDPSGECWLDELPPELIEELADLSLDVRGRLMQAYPRFARDQTQFDFDKMRRVVVHNSDGKETRETLVDGKLHSVDDNPAFYARSQIRRDGSSQERVVEKWFAHGKGHRTRGPAVIVRVDGRVITEEWWTRDVLCNLSGGPCIVEYWGNGKSRKETFANAADGAGLHVDHPSGIVYYESGARREETWSLGCGTLHRHDGPAVVRYTDGCDTPVYMAYYQGGLFHRIDGPAVIREVERASMANGFRALVCKRYYRHGSFARAYKDAQEEYWRGDRCIARLWQVGTRGKDDAYLIHYHANGNVQFAAYNEGGLSRPVPSRHLLPAVVMGYANGNVRQLQWLRCARPWRADDGPTALGFSKSGVMTHEEYVTVGYPARDGVAGFRMIGVPKLHRCGGEPALRRWTDTGDLVMRVYAVGGELHATGRPAIHMDGAFAAHTDLDYYEVWAENGDIGRAGGPAVTRRFTCREGERSQSVWVLEWRWRGRLMRKAAEDDHTAPSRLPVVEMWIGALNEDDGGALHARAYGHTDRVSLRLDDSRADRWKNATPMLVRDEIPDAPAPMRDDVIGVTMRSPGDRICVDVHAAVHAWRPYMKFLQWRVPDVEQAATGARADASGAGSSTGSSDTNT